MGAIAHRVDWARLENRAITSRVLPDPAADLDDRRALILELDVELFT